MITQILSKVPKELADRFKSVVPRNQRNRVLTSLIEEETRRREALLVQTIAAVEADRELSEEMKDWDSTVADGIDDNVPYETR